MAGIDCNDCSRVAYNLTTGRKQLNGDQEIPIRHPPCYENPDACPKVKPGHSDLTPVNAEIFEFYERCRLLNRWPCDDDFFDCWRVILQYVRNAVDEDKEVRRRNSQTELLMAMVRSSTRRM